MRGEGWVGEGFFFFVKIPLKNTVSPNTGGMIRLDTEGKMKEEFLVLRAWLLCVMALPALGLTSGYNGAD